MAGQNARNQAHSAYHPAPARLGTSVVASLSWPVGTVPTPRTRLIGRDTERVCPCTPARGGGPAPNHDGSQRSARRGWHWPLPATVAEAFGDGVVWVDMALLADPALVPEAVAAALGVMPTPQGVLVEDLARSLHARQSLLLLDNCEHLLTATANLLGVLLPAALPCRCWPPAAHRCGYAVSRNFWLTPCRCLLRASATCRSRPRALRCGSSPSGRGACAPTSR